ncbi:MAG TPA: DUF423 domain-containing protein [Leucothrix mucor]|nr:DUF423 domain-containing protein [Leucothrix mucor]
MKKFLLLGSLFALLAVIFGAFGAHGLEQSITDEKILARFHTGVEYQFYHAFGILIIALLIKNASSKLLTSAGIAFTLGIILFSGSLYLYVLTGNKSFGMITPIGGLLFIIGWVLLMTHAYKQK